MRTLEPRWRPLLAQVRDERGFGWNPHRPPRPGEADAARAFAAYAGAWAVEQTPLGAGGGRHDTLDVDKQRSVRTVF